MMTRLSRLAFGALIACLIAACDPGPAGYHGYVEGEYLYIGADEPGRVAALSVRRGLTVDQDAPLFALEAQTFEADKAQAEARLAEARAALANLLAEQQRPEEIEVRLARKRRALADLALARSELDRVRQLFADGFVSQARLDTAQAEFQRASAALAEIEQEIATAKLSARIQLIEQAEAGAAAAEAALSAANERLSRRRVTAPTDGLIHDVLYYPGETVPAGQPVIVLLPPDRRRIVFFVEEPERAGIAPETKVHVTCDGCPGGLTATVDWIADREEFTPPVIFSPDERAKLVYRVEARPDRPLAFAPGQPVSIHTDNPAEAQDEPGAS